MSQLRFKPITRFEVEILNKKFQIPSYLSIDNETCVCVCARAIGHRNMESNPKDGRCNSNVIVIDHDDDDDEKGCNVIIFGVDPGPVNCGFCEYDATNGEVIELERLSFRKKNVLGYNGKKKSADTDIGNVNVIDKVVDFIMKNKDRFKDKLIFVEDQQRDNKEVLAVQHTFQAIFGSRNCFPVAPAAIKACYSDFFPRKEGTESMTPAKRKEVQYAFDKRNAIKGGRKFVPKKVRDDYEQKNPEKKDDAYDAFWVAKFAAEWLIDEQTGQKSESKRKRKRDKNAVNKRPRITKKRIKSA